MAQATKDPNQDLKKRVGRKLRKLEPKSPREIREHLGRHRRSFTQNDSLLSTWLQEELGLEQVTIKAIKNLNNNLEVTVTRGVDKVVLSFVVGTSIQDFLGAFKGADSRVTGCSLTSDQAILVRAVCDRDGGDEAKLVKQALLVGLVNMPAIRSFVRRLKKHPEWHKGMHDAGLYPADIFHAWDNVKKEAKEALQAA